MRVNIPLVQENVFCCRMNNKILWLFNDENFIFRLLFVGVSIWVSNMQFNCDFMELFSKFSQLCEQTFSFMKSTKDGNFMESLCEYLWVRIVKNGKFSSILL